MKKRRAKILFLEAMVLTVVLYAFVPMCSAGVRHVRGGGIEDDDLQMSFDNLDDWLKEKYGIDDDDDIPTLPRDQLDKLWDDLQDLQNQLREKLNKNL